MTVVVLAEAAEDPSPADWFTPVPGWALQKLDWAKRTQPSTAWRVLVADGTGNAPLIRWDALVNGAKWERLSWRLSRDWNAADGPSGVTDRSVEGGAAGLQLPVLSDGAWWLTTKVFGADGSMLKVERYFVNVWNSSTGASAVPTEINLERLSMVFTAGMLDVTGGDARWLDTPDVTLDLIIREFDGALVRSESMPLSVSTGDEQARWIVPIPEATPGRLLRVIAGVREGGRLVDGDEFWVATPGDSSPTPDWGSAGAVPALGTIFAGETMASFAPFESQRKGMDRQVAGMESRGSGAVQLWVQWPRIETISGAYDWSNLDAYVSFLTEKRMPFTLASAGSVLFGNGPFSTWGDWELNHEGKFKLWRNLPVMSPASLNWKRDAQSFTRRMVERYRGNPWLIGYVFIGQGMDSSIFTDHFDSITDYGPAAREGFIRFLKEKYSTVAALNAVWGTHWDSWSEVRSPMPRLDLEVNLTRPWCDFTAWKLEAYRSSTIDVFDPVVAELDPKRAIVHYVVKTGPFEHLLKGAKPSTWTGADGAGEDYRMGRINGITDNWGLHRQTESHDVPPANISYMTDMVSQTLRGEADHIRFNLVWNSLPSLFETKYPETVELQKTLRWWSDTAALRERLAAAQPQSPELGVVLSWSDMLYRVRAWRWYAMPASRADKLVREAGFLPVRWLSEWAPDQAWKGLRTVLVPDDALVWDDGLLQRLRQHVSDGGQLVVWGRAGQYALGDQSDDSHFRWATALGVPPELQAKVPTKLSEKGMAVSVNTEAPETKLTITRNESGRPMVVTWTYGKGSVQWCLTDEATASDAIVTKLLSQSGVPIRVSSSAPEIEGVLRKDGDRQLLVLSRFMGYGKKPDLVPLEARIGLPSLEGDWTIKRLLPAAKDDSADVPSWDEFRRGSAKVALRTSEMQVFELTPVINGVVGSNGGEPDDPLSVLRFAPAPRILRELNTPLPDSEGEIPDGVTVRQLVFESCTVTTSAGPVTNEVYAVIARPTAKGPHPGLLLLHGGRGFSESKRAIMWAKRGYVVVTLDIPGVADPAKVPHSAGEWTSHPYTYERWRVKPVLEDSMMYQSVAAAVQAFRLLSIQSDVDATRLGVHGISWGGYMTAMVSSIMGPEIKAAFAIFGSGHYEESVFDVQLQKLTAEERAAWLKYFDAERRANHIVAPYFLAAAANDFFFWPPAVERTLAKISGEKNQVFAPNANHKLPIPGGTTRDNWPDMPQDYFAYYLQSRGDPMPRVSWVQPQANARQLCFNVVSSRPVVSAGVYYSDTSAVWTKREWKRVGAKLIADGRYVADLPADAGKNVDCYALISDDRPVSVSTLIHRIR
jgi:cephalosporin-C deacetylase-like acetyl esterase